MRDPNPMRWIEAAQAGGYAVGGFNMHNDETTQALLQAAEKADAPIYLQIGRAIIPHMQLVRTPGLRREVPTLTSVNGTP